MVTWESNRNLLAELWPNYQPTDAERELFAERLSKMDQDDVRAAIKAIRAGCERDYKPVLSEIAHEANARRFDRQAGDKSERQPLGWRASWYSPNRWSGKLVAVSSRETFGTAEAARAFASRMGSTPDAFPVG